MKEVQFPENMNYVGGDIVPQIIERLRGAYRRGDRNFILLDITRDDLPEADLWLCRDCLAHLSYADVRKALENFADRKSRMRLSQTTFNETRMWTSHRAAFARSTSD